MSDRKKFIKSIRRSCYYKTWDECNKSRTRHRNQFPPADNESMVIIHSKSNDRYFWEIREAGQMNVHQFPKHRSVRVTAKQYF